MVIFAIATISSAWSDKIVKGWSKLDEWIRILSSPVPSSTRVIFSAAGSMRSTCIDESDTIQGTCWHRPVIVRDMETRLGEVIGHLKVVPERPDDDVIDNDLILVWGSQRRIITGSDLLGRLLRGIVSIEASNIERQQGVR